MLERCMGSGKDHPVLGSGLGNWKIASIAYGKNTSMDILYPTMHNDFLQFAAELGFLVSWAIRDCLPFSLYFTSLFCTRTRSPKKKMASPLGLNGLCR